MTPFCFDFYSRETFSCIRAHAWLSVCDRSHNFPRKNGLFRYLCSGARANARDQNYAFSRRKICSFCRGKAYLVRVPCSCYLLSKIWGYDNQTTLEVRWNGGRIAVPCYVRLSQVRAVDGNKVVLLNHFWEKAIFNYKHHSETLTLMKNVIWLLSFFVCQKTSWLVCN